MSGSMEKMFGWNKVSEIKPEPYENILINLAPDGELAVTGFMQENGTFMEYRGKAKAKAIENPFWWTYIPAPHWT